MIILLVILILPSGCNSSYLTFAVPPHGGCHRKNGNKMPEDSGNPAALNLRTYARLIFVNDHTLGSVGLPSRTVNYHARSGPDQMFVDFSPGFIDVMDRLAKYVTNRIVCPFSANHDSFTRLISGYGAVRARSGFRCRRACLRERQWRNQCASQSNNCLFHDDASPFLIVDVLLKLRGSHIRRTALRKFFVPSFGPPRNSLVRSDWHYKKAAGFREPCGFRIKRRGGC